MMHYKHYTLLLLGIFTQFTSVIAQLHIKKQGVIGGNGDDILTSLYLTKDGGLIAGGYSYSNASAQKTESSRGDADYWVVKLDSTRKIQWNKTVGGNSYELLNTVIQTRDGGYVLGGFSLSNISAEKTENSRGIHDYWIVKLDSNHNIQWDKTIGGNSIDAFASLQQTKDGGYILGGISYSNKSGEKTENSRGDFDYWIVKLNANGDIKWDKTIGGSGTDILKSLQQTSDGGYILGGDSYSYISGEKTEDRRGADDYWIVKIGAGGNVQWDKTIGGAYSEEFASVQQTKDGGYILGGSSYSDISGEKTENSRGNFDFWVVKTSSTGNIQWDKTIGGSLDDRMAAVYEIKKNSYVVGGSSYSGISGDKTGDNRSSSFNSRDYWLLELKYVKPDSTAIAQLQNTPLLKTPAQRLTNTFTIYPNPVAKVLHVQNTSKAIFILSDQSGKKILSKTLNGNGDIQVANLSAGTYYLTNINTNTTQKVIVAK